MHALCVQNECTMRTLTIRNVPDEVYEQLKAEAARNHRSLNQEALLKVLRNIEEHAPTTEQKLARLREFHKRLPPELDATMDEVDEWKREGRL